MIGKSSCFVLFCLFVCCFVRIVNFVFACVFENEIVNQNTRLVENIINIQYANQFLNGASTTAGRPLRFYRSIPIL